MGTYAATNDSSKINLMSTVSGKTFDKAAFKQLFGIIANKSGATLNDVKAAVAGKQNYGSTQIPTLITAQDISGYNGGNDLKVKFGEYYWTVTSLTRTGEADGTGDPILTLYLDVSEVRSKDASPFVVNKDGVGWADDTDYNKGGATLPGYISNIYSTSYVRVNKLNAGGQWTVSKQALSDYQSQDQSSPYAKFTMDSVAGNYTEYIVKPAQVKYQQIENNKHKSNSTFWSGWSLKNDAYGIPDGQNWYDGAGSKDDMSTKFAADIENGTGYAAWQNDYLWLPSITETGSADYPDGIWLLSEAQMQNTSTVDEFNTWTRSGDFNFYGNCFFLQSNGKSGCGLINASYAVRPALHLNLAKAAAAACGIEHSYGSDWESDENNHWHTCTLCGAIKDSAAHTESAWITDTAATCTTPGSKHIECTECKKVLETQTVSVKEHNWGTEWQSDNDNHWHVCKDCSAESEHTGHTESAWITDTAATCTTPGSKHIECTECKKVLETQTVSVKEHNWGTEWQSDKDNHWHVCKDCSAESEHTGHTPQTIPAKDATCTQTGLTAGSKCSVCQKILTAQTEVPLKEHSWNSGEVTKEATCAEEGVKTFICTVCGETETEPIEKLPHTWDADWKNDEINHWHECTACGERKDGAAHVRTTDPAVAPDCTQTGLTEGCHCSVCEKVITAQEKVEALGHNFEWVITKQPTTTETGLKKNICSACGEVDGEEEIAKLVEDENGNVSDLPVLDDDSRYKLEINIKATNTVYSGLEGENKGYKIQLWILKGGEDDKQEFNNTKELNLSLIVPDGMEEFTLYKLVAGGFEKIDPNEYKIEAGVLSIRTTLPVEFIFNKPAPEPEKAGTPWWVWLIVGLGVAAIAAVVAVVVIIKKKRGTPPTPETVVVSGAGYDDTELKRKVEEQNEKIDELLHREPAQNVLDQTLSDDEMRSFFTDDEISAMVKDGKITQADCDRIVKGRK